MTRPEVRVLALDPGGLALRIYQDPVRTAAELAEISAKDSKNYSEFHANVARLGQAIAPLLLMTPPDIDHLKLSDYRNLGKVALKFRSLDKKNIYRLLRWAPMPIADLVSEWFETDLLQATIAARGIFGTFAGPRSAGTSAGLLLQAAMDGHAVAPAAFVKGGVEALTRALTSAASAAGAKIRMNSDVVRVCVEHGKVASVILADGEEIFTSTVVSNADPQSTFLKLVDPVDLDPSFVAKVRNYRCVGASAFINLVLSDLPKAAPIAERIHIGSSIDYLERAFDAAKYGDFSSQPCLDIIIPSLIDPSLAPAGTHLMSIYVQYAPYRLQDGDWKSRREEFGDMVVRALSEYMPNLRRLIVHRQIITPLDLEQTYGLSGGHILHGEPSLDQLFMFRPLLGWAQYRTPIKGLYLCGAGTHPGGVTGAPGANASREIIRDLKRRH